MLGRARKLSDVSEKILHQPSYPQLSLVTRSDPSRCLVYHHRARVLFLLSAVRSNPPIPIKARLTYQNSWDITQSDNVHPCLTGVTDWLICNVVPRVSGFRHVVQSIDDFGDWECPRSVAVSTARTAQPRGVRSVLMADNWCRGVTTHSISHCNFHVAGIGCQIWRVG